MPDSVIDTISLRDDRLAAKQAARERAIKQRRSERAAGRPARYPIYGLRFARNDVTPVGWVERSDTHQCRCVWRWVSRRSTHPTQI